MSAADDDPLQQWDYHLPEERIARYPPPERDASRLMTLPLDSRLPPRHLVFAQLPKLLQAGDLLVGNDTRVMRARLWAHRRTGGRVELLLLGHGPGPVEALARPARRIRVGEVLELDGGGTAEVCERMPAGLFRLALDPAPIEVMERQGRLPLPPYLHRGAEALDDARYQTVFAGPLGAAAAPTAGLHFTPALLESLHARGIGFATITLHVGLGTFRPLRHEDLARSTLHAERWEIPAETAAMVADTRARRGRVIAIGTTAVRSLEAAARLGVGTIGAGSGTTDLFLRPPDRPSAIDGLITNFHLPRSSLLMLVACLVGRERLLHAYEQAIAQGYRFYSYGDAMLLL